MCLLLFSPGPTPVLSAVTLPTSTHRFILSLLFPSLDDYMSALGCPGRGLTLNTCLSHTHTHRQSPHQVWLIWLVTHVSRAITGIQMFHSPFVCAPPLYTHTLSNTHMPGTHLLTSPPLASSSQGCDAACSVLLFWLFLLCFSEVSVSCDYLLCIRRKRPALCFHRGLQRLHQWLKGSYQRKRAAV